MSATARASAHPVTPRKAGTQSGTRRRATLREVPAPRAKVAGNGVFTLIVVALLLGGMVTLLALNTTLAQGAFEIGSLTKVSRDLAVTEQRLLQTVARAEAPESLQDRADRLGMVPASTPVFLRLADDKVLGSPTPAKTNAAKSPASTRSRTTGPATTGTTTASTRTGTAKPGSITTGSAAITSADSTSDEAVPDAPTAPKAAVGAAQSDAAVADPAPSGVSQP